MVTVLAFYSDDPSLILAGYLNFLYEKDKKRKIGWVWPIFLKIDHDKFFMVSTADLKGQGSLELGIPRFNRLSNCPYRVKTIT